VSNCNCIKDVDQKIKKQTNDPDACVDWAIVGLFAGHPQYLPKINYTYRKSDKKGTLTKKTFEGTIIPTFCPFCGVKYEIKIQAVEDKGGKQ